MRPFISVIIPAYNAESTIAEALESVASQTVFRSSWPDGSAPEVQVLVVDDASTDRTIDVARKAFDALRASHGVDVQGGGEPRWTIAYDQLSLDSNSGPAAVRNYGLARATGEWVAFLDSDDAWLPERLEVQLAMAEKYPDAIMWCGDTIDFADGGKAETGADRRETGCPSGSSEASTLKGEEGRSNRRWPQMNADGTGDRKPGVGSPRELYEITLETLAVENPVATSTVLVRKSVLDEVGGFDEQFRGPEDYDLWLGLASLGRVVKIQQPLSRYRSVAGSLSMDDRRFLPEVLRVLDKAFGPGGALEQYQELADVARASQNWSASWMAFSRGDRLRAIRLWMRAYMLKKRTGVQFKEQWWSLLGRYCLGPGVAAKREL